MTSKTSTDGTKYMLGVVEAHLERKEAALANLKTCTELEVTVSYGRPKEKLTHNVTLKATDKVKSQYGDYFSTEYTLPDGGTGIKSFENEVKNRIYNTERMIEAIKSDIKFYKKMIAEYKGA